MSQLAENISSALPLGFVSFESHHFPAGGLASVLRHLATNVAAEYQGKVFVLTPFHRRCDRLRQLETETIADLVVDFDGKEKLVHVLCHEENIRIGAKNIHVSWIFLAASDRRFFDGKENPYDLGSTPSEREASLRRDSLFFGAAAAKALERLAGGGRLRVVLQDWEALTTRLAVPPDQNGHIDFYACLHNTYDSPLSDTDLQRLCVSPGIFPGTTVLSRSLGFVHSPVITVSQQFASDVFSEPIQALVFATHLQQLFRSVKLYGIDHGPFKDVRIPALVLDKARRGSFDLLRDWKAACKAQTLNALLNHKPTTEQPIWGDVRKFHRAHDSPWFFMSGRDDTRQKGFCVAASAAARLLADPETSAQFLFFPRPGEEKLPGLNFLRKLAEQHPGRVLVVPFDVAVAYEAALAGSDYGLLPSFFEPGGMVSEMTSMVPICRATGGALQLVVPWHASASCNRAVQERSARWHSSAAQPTGILFRESDYQDRDIAGDWQGLCAAAYSLAGSPDRVEERNRYPVFREMTAELLTALKEAVRLYRERPERYYRMILAGIAHLEDNFSWQKAARETLRILKH